MRLEGKVAIVTGGAGGMGAVEAEMFAREGAKVVVADLLEDEGRKVVAAIAEAGGACIFLRLDVTDEDAWERTVASTVEKFGKLDVLVNNAGITGSFTEDLMSTEAWDTLMDVNAKGVFLGMKYAIPEMRKAGGGSIVNISSISGFIGQEHLHPAYNASKGAVRILTKATAVQYAREGIRINSVHPGVMPPMRSPVDVDLDERERMVLQQVPMGRSGRREEVANGVLFLASDEASYITGTELVIDGGYLAL
jgi:NAD(P)-dependent dehydrogenase (short-subunit alcohol dehydrogenase family)